MSVDLSWTVDREAGVWFVACRVHNAAAVARRVRIRSRLDGPVLPPRRSGVPEAGWDADGVTLRLDPDERRGIGFAVAAADARDPPVAVAESDRIDEDATDSDRSARAAVRDLDDHRPPRDAVSDGDRTAAVASAADAPVSTASDPSDATVDFDRIGPNRVTDWLDAVEGRIERAERLTDADLETATEVVAAAGGLDAVDALDDRIDADAEALERVRDRAAALADRAEATDAPSEALDRLA